MERYKLLEKLIHKYKPKSICEIGINKGERAISMCFAALEHNSDISYTGYDLFDAITPEINEQELNVKKSYPYGEILARLATKLPTVEVNLIKGNTRDVLEEAIYDFVWIDGGHSIETIQNDYEKVKNSKVIVLDDYYEIDEFNRGINIEKFGCNKLIETIPHSQILGKDLMDRTSEGGFVRIVLVDNTKK